ncbi:BRO-N domain-containing protein [Morganella morganii]|uniref:BRO-N domain-containing protein n=1 Tax=Morganella morganii TaxID=582 RepID=UPI003EBCD52B
MNSVAKTDLTFQDITFEPVYQDGQMWLTSTELAKALGYSRTDNVSRVYSRNSDEFTESMTTTVKMTLVRKTGEVEVVVRLFSLRGAHLIAMFASTPVAKRFRKWVLDILDREIELGNHSPAFHYHYPIESADVHDRKFQNTWLTARRLLDERNPAPDLALLDQLEADGFDVTGAKARIYALYNVAETTVSMEDVFAELGKMLQRLKDNFKWGAKTGGLNVTFEGNEKGLVYGGFKKRHIGCH